MLFKIRIPRIVMAILCGIGLSVSGVLYQMLFQNELASPDLLGVASGASFGASLAIALGWTTAWVQVSALSFGAAAVFLTVAISNCIHGRQRIEVTMILTGMLIGILFNAGINLMEMAADPTIMIRRVRFWQIGALSSATYQQVFRYLPLFFAGLIPAWLLRWRLNLVSLSQDEAKAIGINVRFLRGACIFSATVLSAGIVAFCGNIGWLGLIIPHLCRIIFGPDMRKLVPSTALAGTAFLLLSDDLSRSLFAFEIPVGYITSSVGMVLFALTILYRRKAAK